MDERVVARLTDYLRRRLPRKVREDAFDVYFGDDEPDESDGGLFTPWVLFEYRTDDGKSVADRFVERGGPLGASEASWLDAQRHAWLSVWEVLEVRRGEGVVAVDLLTGQKRDVLERSASETLEPRLATLARVADHDGVSLFVGMNARPLPPKWADVVVKEARKAMRMGRARHVSVDRLRELDATAGLVHLWREVVRAMETAPLPQLANTDGDPLLLTTDRFSFDPGVRDAVLAALQGIELAELDESGDGTAVVFHKTGNAMHAHWDNTVVGRAKVRDATLLLETNSIVRADGLRESVEKACGPLVRHVIREHSDPQARLGEPRSPHEASSDPEPPPEVAEALLDFKKRHFVEWLDTPLPALSGKSPRDAAATPAGRKRLDVLLKEIEWTESRVPEAQRIDVNELRQALGMLPKKSEGERQLELTGLTGVTPKAPRTRR